MSNASSPEARFEQFYRSHTASVTAYFRRRITDDEVQDAVADVFLTAWRRLDVALPGGLPWLYRAAHLTLRNTQRTQFRYNRTNSRLAGLASPGSPDIGDLSSSRGVVITALCELSDGDREILFLTYWEEVELRTVADVLGCTKQTAAVRLHRARKRLARVLLTDSGPNADDSPTNDMSLEEANR